MQNRASDRLRRLWEKFADKAFRDGFVLSHLSSNIAAQIAVMRDKRKLTQTELAAAAGMRQSQISELENPSSKGANLKTLAKIASAFDVAVVIRFVPFSEVAKWAADGAAEQVNPCPFDQDSIDGASAWTWRTPTISQSFYRARINTENCGGTLQISAQDRLQATTILTAEVGHA